MKLFGLDFRLGFDGFYDGKRLQLDLYSLRLRISNFLKHKSSFSSEIFNKLDELVHKRTILSCSGFYIEHQRCVRISAGSLTGRMAVIVRPIVTVSVEMHKTDDQKYGEPERNGRQKASRIELGALVKANRHHDLEQFCGGWNVETVRLAG